MAHFAKLDINNVVLSVLVVENSKTTNVNGIEEEDIGIKFLEKITGWPLWKKTSYNTRGGKYYNQDGSEGDQSKAYRGNYAGMGLIYDQNNNIFIPQKPFSSWSLNISKASWEAPISMPNTQTNGLKDEYNWNESLQSWDKIVRTI
jgi:hypothetical protein